MSKKPTSSSERDRLGMTHDDWQRMKAMTDAEITAAALSDPDAQPISKDQLAKARRPSPAKVIRHKLRMDRQTFATTYGLSLDALIAWERHELVPSLAEMSYLRLIEREPELSKLALAS